MVHITIDLDDIRSPGYTAMYCERCGNRTERVGTKQCGNCEGKLLHSSTYEWRLYDALERELNKRGIEHIIKQQFSTSDDVYHWDIYVWVDGKSRYGGCGYLIEVNGPEHDTQYGRYKDQKKLRHALSHTLRPGIEFRNVKNEDCTVVMASITARKIVKELVERAN